MTDLVEQAQAVVSDVLSNDVAANLGDVANTALDNTDLSALEGLTDGLQQTVQQAVEGALTEGVVGNTEGQVGDLIAEAIGGEPLPPAQVFL